MVVLTQVKDIEWVPTSTKFRIALDNNKFKGIEYKPQTNLKQVLQKMCFDRGVSTEGFVARDPAGRVIKDLDVPLISLKTQTISFLQKKPGLYLRT